MLKLIIAFAILTIATTTQAQEGFSCRYGYGNISCQPRVMRAIIPERPQVDYQAFGDAMYMLGAMWAQQAAEAQRQRQIQANYDRWAATQPKLRTNRKTQRQNSHRALDEKIRECDNSMNQSSARCDYYRKLRAQ